MEGRAGRVWRKEIELGGEMGIKEETREWK